MPHWLGSVEVEDLAQLEHTSEELAKRGATILAPSRPSGDGRHAAVVRDPGGAILGLTTPPADARASVAVSWRVLNTHNVRDAIANYEALFGWTIAKEASTGPHGAFHEFRFGNADERTAGAMADISGRPGVHPHWLFFFDVASVDEAVALSRRAGGTATDPIVLPAGARIAICEDPQRAAFGVIG